jgi:hypothetical protein
MNLPYAVGSTLRLSLLFLFFATVGGLLRADDTGLPDATDPVAGMGVDIHFLDAQPGELEMLSQAGFHWVRIDLVWAATEKQPGVYDFSSHDRLQAELAPFHLRTMVILDYTNPLYDGGKPTCTEAGRQAFASWAVAAVNHFKGRGIIWEIWNEPNGEWFWKPKPNPADYARLAMTVTAAIHEAAPDEIVVGPALSAGIPWPDPAKTQFLDTVAGSGVLKYWPAITVHPYIQTAPEKFADIYDTCRAVAQKHVDPGQKIALICGESGFAATWHGFDAVKQGQYVARLFLFNVLEGIPLTISYDWRNDGNNPKDDESNYGTVLYDYHAGADPVFTPKPAYLAAKTYSSQLAGTHFVERLKTASPDDYLLSFTGPAGNCVVAWTAAKAHDIQVPLDDGPWNLTSYDGKKQTQVTSLGGLTLNIDGGPQYLKK